MKALVVYSSQTGNTKKLAQTVYDNLDCEKELVSVNEAPDPGDYDLVAVGFWLQAGKPDLKSLKYLDRIEDSKVFLFATHGAASGSDHVANALSQARDCLPKATFVGSFTCQGEVNPKVLEKVKAKPEPPVRLDDAADAVGHPDGEDLTRLQKAVLEAVK